MKNKLLENLISIKSYSGQENSLKHFIAGWFAKRGILTIEQGDNLIVHIKGKNSEKAFIFNSHMDTVSAGDESMWKYGPWTPTYEDNKLIGLGASDMKSGLAASMLTCDEFSKNKPPIDVWFTYVVKEEQDGTGTKDFVEWFVKKGYPKKYKKMAAIFTEPTAMFGIEHGHRGNLFINAITTGDSGHASRPHLNNNHAVINMINFSVALEKQVKEWQKEFVVDKFYPPSVGLFTSICAGIGSDGSVESPNKFPASCNATFDIRTVPGFHEVAFEKINDLGNRFGVNLGLEFPAGPAGYTDPDDKLVKITEMVLGKSELSVSQGSADLGFLTQIGIKGVTLGPGDKSQSHHVNESCNPNMVNKAVGIYSEIVTKWGKD